MCLRLDGCDGIRTVRVKGTQTLRIWFGSPRASGKTDAPSDDSTALRDTMLVRKGEYVVNRPYGAVALGTVSVALGLCLAACAQDATHPAGVTASRSVKASVSATPSATDASASAAIAAYRAMWEDTAEASRTSDPKNPRLNDHAQGGALSLLQYTMEQARKAGTTGRGAPRADPTVVKASASKVELRDCVDGSKWVQVKPSKSPSRLSGGSYRTEATVVLSSGTWKVSELYWEDAGTCLG